MKLLALSIALVGCLPVFAQDQPKRLPGTEYTVFRTRIGYFARGTLQGDPFSATTTSIQSDVDLHLLRLKGNVEITIKGVIMQADEVDCHTDTGEIEPRGNVHLKAAPEQ